MKIYDSKPTHGSMSSHALRISSSDGVQGRNGIVSKNRSIPSPSVVATLLLVEFSMVADSLLILKTVVSKLLKTVVASKLLKKPEAKDIQLVS